VRNNALDLGALCVATIGPNPCAGLGLGAQGADGRQLVTAANWGVGVNVGLLYVLDDATHVGLNYRSAVRHDLAGTAIFQIPAIAAPLTAGGLFQNTGVRSSLTFPDVIALGISHKLNDRLTILADLDWTGWHRLSQLNVDFANPAQPDETLPLHWKNSIRFAVGGIYSITDNIGLRAGVSYDETPTSITFRSADLPDSNEIMGSAGFSYRFNEHLSTIVSYSYGHSAAAMTPRCENAERALAEAESGAQAPENEDGYIKSLRAEIATLHKSIASQAAELGRTRAALAQTRAPHIQRGLENRPIENLRHVSAEDYQTAQGAKRKGLIRDCIVVSAIIIPLVLFYPSIAVYLPQEVRDGIATATGGLLRVEVVQPTVLHAPPRKSLPPPKSERPTAIASRAMNVHASPGSKGAVIISLQKKASVVVLGKRGNWTEIEVPAQRAGQPRQGWVWSAYLQDNDN